MTVPLCGLRLVQLSRTPFGGGYGTAREIYTMLRGAIDGLELVERQADSNV
jgi:hypothetical protein